MSPPWARVVLILCFVLPLRANDCFVPTNGSDSATGSPEHPFRTIQKGLDAVSQTGGSVTVRPGVYHEELTIRPGARNPVVLKSAEPHGAVIDGAERVTGWKQIDRAHNVWERDFGSKAPYSNDRGRWDMEPRSEQVFVEGRRCTHVKEGAALEALPEYGFTATLSEPAHYVLKLPVGMDPNSAATEITTRGTLLKVRSDRAVIDEFVFRRAETTYQQAMVMLNGDSVEFRGNLLEYASAGSGLAIQGRHARVHHNTMRANGQFGFSMGGAENVVEDNEVSGNDLAGYKEWGTGGTKIVGNANVVRRNRFIGNRGGVAIWLDSGPCNNVIEYNYVSGNYGEGIRSEISFHNLIAYNIVEGTLPCTSTMFGRTTTHCIGISVQNSSETWVVNNLVKDNRGTGIQLFTYRRKDTDLPAWQINFPDERHREWLKRARAEHVVQAYDNRFFNNVVIQDTADATGPCVAVLGLWNGEAPHCHGNELDYTFYWNPVTHAPKVQFRNGQYVPDGASEWRTRDGLDAHARGGFSPADYGERVFDAAYPYLPTAAFVRANAGRALTDVPWTIEADFIGQPADREHPTIGHVQAGR